MRSVHFETGDTTACGLDLDEWYFSSTRLTRYVTCVRCMPTALTREQQRAARVEQRRREELLDQRFAEQQRTTHAELVEEYLRRLNDVTPGDACDDIATDLYRYFDMFGKLIYVGISFSAFVRANSHRHGSPWFHEARVMTIEKYPSRSEAMAAERTAILDERPVYNVQGTAR